MASAIRRGPTISRLPPICRAPIQTIDQISGDEGPENRRRVALAKAASFYQALADTLPPARPAQRAGTAHACQRLGAGPAQLGNSAGAAAAFAEAIASCSERLRRKAPDRAEFARRLEECRQQQHCSTCRNESPPLCFEQRRDGARLSGSRPTCTAT